MKKNKTTIIINRVELYRDFSINLIHYIDDYYLDPITLNNDNDIYNHFNWCFNKVCDEFLMEGVDFRENVDLKKYFFKYYYKQYYMSEEKIKINNFIKFWNSIFNVEKQKNENMISVFIELYHVFDKSLELKKELNLINENT